MKFILVSPKNRTAYNFRGDLIKKIISKGYEVVVTGPNRIDVDKIEELGARFVEIPINKNGVNPFADLKYQKALYNLFVKEQPDVVLGYTSKPVIYGTIAAKKASKKLKKPIRAVSMITGMGYAFTAETLKARLIRMIMSILYKYSLKKADMVVFQNEDDKIMLEKLKLVNKSKTAVVNGSGVNTERFSVQPLPETTTFFMLARIMYSKGIREYLQAAKIVKEKHKEVRFMLLGALEGIQDSISKEDLKPYIDGEIIEYFGETNKVEDYYKQCSVYVLPSYREGTPRTVLEAGSMGRPIITTDAPGCRSTVIDGETGYLVPIKNAEVLAEKMERFIENPELIKSMGKASAEYIRKKYDVVKVNETMLEYLGI
ncbi:MAG: glycosyltransferase family 4 protein [Clostridia bacterium]|nr:glycosyltransferase family 4 protein [Clostridia bacterium]